MAHKIGGISGGRDENGIIFITQPWWCETLAECFTVGEPSLAGIPQSRRDFGVWDPELTAAGYQVGISYEGRDTTFPDAESETFSLESETETQPIETHFNIAEIMAKFAGRIVGGEEDPKVVFDEQLPDPSIDNPNGFNQDTLTFDKIDNPYFGRTTYELYGAIWVHTYSRASIPSNLLSRIGEVLKSPPGNPPTPDGRDWVTMAPEVTVYRSSGGVRISDRYKLSPPNGWPPGITGTFVI